MAATKITEKDIRVFIMDKPELNPLLRGVRFSAEDIDAAVIYAVDYFNMASPPNGTSYTVETFPFRYLMLIGTTGHLLKGAAVNEASNQLSYALDGVQVNDKDKAEIFGKLGTQFWDDYRMEVTNIKINQNVARAYGTCHSEYRRIAR